MKKMLLLAMVTGTVFVGLGTPIAMGQATGEAAGQGQKAPPSNIQVLAPARSGWLGLRMGLVPEAVASQLSLQKGHGVIVRNLVVGGPADQAGLRQYDVIVRLNGKQVKLVSLPGVLRKFKPGDKIQLGVMQGGKIATIPLTLGKPLPVGKARMKHEEEPQTVWKDHLRWQGGVLRRGRNDMAGRTPTPQELSQMMRSAPAGGWQIDVQMGPDGAVSAWTMRRQHNGTAMEIQHHKDGRVTVRRTRTGDDGKKQTLAKTYKDAAALQAGDSEAYKTYHAMTAQQLRAMAGPRPEAAPAPGPRMTGATPLPDAYRLRADKFRRELEQQIDRQVAKELDLIQKHLEADREEGRPLTADEAARFGRMMKDMLHPSAAPPPPAEREFSVHPDGRIDVRLRQGAGDLTLQFRNAADLKQREPKLFEHYQALRESLAR